MPTNNAVNIATALRDYYKEDRVIEWELVKAVKLLRAKWMDQNHLAFN